MSYSSPYYKFFFVFHKRSFLVANQQSCWKILNFWKEGKEREKLLRLRHENQAAISQSTPLVSSSYGQETNTNSALNFCYGQHLF